VPFDGATDISRTIYLDYIGSSPLQQRNWCPNWTTPASSMAISRRSDGSKKILFGSLDGSGNVLKLGVTGDTDNGSAINGFYQTAYAGGNSGRNSFQYLTASVKGSGILSMAAVQPDTATVVNLESLVLQNPPNKDVEWPGIRVVAERAALRFGTNAPGDHFSMQKAVLYGRPHPFGRTRGIQT
jgi:hypothetical protein